MNDPSYYYLQADIIKFILIVLPCMALVLVLGGAIYLPVKESHARKRKLKQIYAEREPLDEHEFHERFFKSRGVPADVVIKVRRIIEDEFFLDMSRIRSQDDFTGNLAFLFGKYSLGVDGVEIIWRFEKEFGFSISDEEATRMKTVDDIVMIIWDKVQRKDFQDSSKQHDV